MALMVNAILVGNKKRRKHTRSLFCLIPPEYSKSLHRHTEFMRGESERGEGVVALIKGNREPQTRFPPPPPARVTVNEITNGKLVAAHRVCSIAACIILYVSKERKKKKMTTRSPLPS